MKKNTTENKRNKKTVKDLKKHINEIKNIKETEFYIYEREREQLEIINYASKYAESGKPSIIHIYGTPGTGKTHTIKNTIKFLEENLQINIYYLNVIGTKNFVSTLNSFKNKRKRFMLFIDEVDLLKNKFYEIFDTIYEMNILCFVISNTFIISHLRNFKKNKNEKINKILSRIGDISIKFEPYSFKDFQVKCSNRYAARYLSTYGDMRKVNEINKIMGHKSDMNASDSIKVVKNTFMQLINLVEISVHEKIVLEYIYAHDILDYADYYAYCKLRDLETINTENFEFVIKNLTEKGFLKKLKPTFLKEELKNILK